MATHLAIDDDLINEAVSLEKAMISEKGSKLLVGFLVSPVIPDDVNLITAITALTTAITSLVIAKNIK